MGNININDFNQELLNNTSNQLINILVDFCNQFMTTFPNIMNKEELLNRINQFKGIKLGNYLNDGNCNYSEMVIEINEKFQKDENALKSVIYHELIHSLSIHFENNLDYGYSSKSPHYGLWRDTLFETDDNFVLENPTLDEIMTEYYNTRLLKSEGINIGDEYTLCSYGFFGKDYVEYNGTGYYSMVALGNIYDYLFGEKIMKAKLFDGNDFRKSFNETFKNISFNVEGNALPYSKFVVESGPDNRYTSSIQLFGKYLENKISNNGFDIDEVIKESIKFQSMLPKRKEHNEIRVSDSMYSSFLEEEKRIIIQNLYNTELGVNSNIIFYIYEVIKKIKMNNPNINLDNVSYNLVSDKEYEGVIINIDGNNYLSSLKNSLRQNELAYRFDNCSKEIYDVYKNEYNIKLGESEFVRDWSCSFSLIKDDNTYYNRFGEIVNVSPSFDLIINNEKDLDDEHKKR